jgi:glycosyltransferase involved in cell wall biosynthesis
MKVLLITSEWDLCPFIERQVEFLRERSIEIDVFIFRGNKSPFQYLRAWIRIRKMFLFSKYDLIHANFGQSALLAMPLIKPLVVSFHGSDLLGIKRKNGKNTFTGFILQSWSKYVSKLAAKVTTVSHEMANNLPKTVEYCLLPCGVDLELFKPASSQQCREKLNLSGDKKLILFGGRPERLDKRLWLAKKCVSEISAQYNAELVTMSSVPHEKVPEYINACNLVLLTSKQEGSPNIVKEALACNVPVVSVDVGDVRERITNIKGCFISESDSPAHIIKALVKGLTFNEEFKGREEDKVIDQLVEIYRDSIYSKKKIYKTSKSEKIGI